MEKGDRRPEAGDRRLEAGDGEAGAGGRAGCESGTLVTKFSDSTALSLGGSEDKQRRAEGVFLLILSRDKKHRGYFIFTLEMPPPSILGDFDQTTTTSDSHPFAKVFFR